jgi:hypothetical protein
MLCSNKPLWLDCFAAKTLTAAIFYGEVFKCRWSVYRLSSTLLPFCGSATFIANYLPIAHIFACPLNKGRSLRYNPSVGDLKILIRGSCG